MSAKSVLCMWKKQGKHREFENAILVMTLHGEWTGLDKVRNEQPMGVRGRAGLDKVAQTKSSVYMVGMK